MCKNKKSPAGIFPRWARVIRFCDMARIGLPDECRTGRAGRRGSSKYEMPENFLRSYAGDKPSGLWITLVSPIKEETFQWVRQRRETSADLF